MTIFNVRKLITVVLTFAFVYKTNGVDNVETQLGGKGITADRYDSSGWSDGAAKSGDDLKCNFESNCCWKNEVPPKDQLDWVLMSGHPDRNKIQTYFGTTVTPSGKYLVVATSQNPASKDNAQFVSCKLGCTNDEIKVSLKHWATNGLVLRVCLKDVQNSGDSLLNCQKLTFQNQPGPTELTFPPVQNANIVIVANNFVAKSIAIIDDIQVTFVPCASTTTTISTTTVTTPTTTVAPVVQPPVPVVVANDPSVSNPVVPSDNSDTNCKSVVCDFEQGDTCSYQQKTSVSNNMNLPRSWELSTGPYRNPATGIRRVEQGNICLAVYLKPHDTASMETSTDFTDDRVVKFLVYKVADKIELKGCCDDVGTCPYSTALNVSIEDYAKWKTGSFLCPKGTKKIIFQGNNSGDNEGAIGLDDIQLLLPNRSSSINAQDSACTKQN